ncbi:MAG: transglycosylase domain-containing protein, partial [Smithella sp.]
MEPNDSNTKMNSSRPRSKRKRLIIVTIISIIVAVLSTLIVVEMKTSYLQSRYLSLYAKKLSFSVKPGPNPSLNFPEDGPYDERLGYTQLPSFIKRLTAQGYQVESQARPSYSLNEVTESGLFTTFREKTQAGLKIYSNDGGTLFDAMYPQKIYNNFESIPPLITNSLLFIENRELLDLQNPGRNPAVEWDRLAKAMIDKGINVFNSGHHFAGGSTLATQIEKFRHSPEGRTSDPYEKLKQMASASLRAYLSGPDTTGVRRQLVVDYLNSVPLAAISGYGEVNGIGDGLWAVYGTDFNSVNRLLCESCGLNDPRRAEVYKQVLSLFIAQRRPSFYLVTDRNALETLTNTYLRALYNAGIIPKTLRDSALQAKLNFRKGPPEIPAVSFVGRKAANTIRRQLSYLLNVSQLYELDRLDLTVKSTLNSAIQDDVSKLLQNLKNPQFVGEAGLKAFRLLEQGDPERVIYSFTLYERVGTTNLLRIQTDNFDQPFDINEGVKIELGSTAKLRTLVTYLEIIADLYERHKELPSEKLRAISVERGDRLTQWVLEYLSTTREPSLHDILEAAMERRYSASPGEVFFTGGGQHTFHNFEKSDNGKMLSVRDGLRNSVNLVFIRIMR